MVVVSGLSSGFTGTEIVSAFTRAVFRIHLGFQVFFGSGLSCQVFFSTVFVVDCCFDLYSDVVVVIVIAVVLVIDIGVSFVIGVDIGF